MSDWQIVPLPLHGPLFLGAIDVYSAAFALPPYSDPDRGDEIRARLLDVHQYREGFRAFCAVGTDGSVLGITYGYHGEPGQWWHDTVAAALPPGEAARWLADSYELVELAVHPAHQNRGIGNALIAALLEGATGATCVLSTRSDSRAHRLYRRLGFQVLTEMRFVPGVHPSTSWVARFLSSSLESACGSSPRRACPCRLQGEARRILQQCLNLLKEARPLRTVGNAVVGR